MQTGGKHTKSDFGFGWVHNNFKTIVSSHV